MNQPYDNPNDPVKLFCKDNKIEYSWDWNERHGAWNEIFIDDKLLMQITQGIKIGRASCRERV